MEIVLVRHAQPEWEPGGFAVDRPSLTPFGRAQAQRTGAALAFERFDHFYASPLERARETAEVIAGWMPRPPEYLSWLEELRLPSLEGATSEQVEQFFRNARTRDLEAWWGASGPGGESFRHFYERVASGIESLLCGPHGAEVRAEGAHRLWQIPDPERRVLIVAHEGTNAVILSHLLGIEPIPWAFLRFSTAWCGISKIRTLPVASARVWVLESFNRIGHLDGLRAPP
jgi:broad specificity phosphatase PhoE